MMFLVAGPAWADTDVTVDGDLGEWPDPVFGWLDENDSWLISHRDVQEVWVTDNNDSGSNGYLFLAVQMRGNFREELIGINIDVIIKLDVNGDGDADDAQDRIIEFTGDPTAQPPTLGTVTTGTGAWVADVPASDWAYSGPDVEVQIPYSVLGLSHGSDSFGIGVETQGLPWLGQDYSPEPDEDSGQDIFVNYDGTQDPEPLAAKIVGVTATLERGGVRLHWATGSERENAGFHVYRLDAEGRPVRLTRKPVPGQVGAALGSNYTFVDQSGGPWDQYLVEDIETTGRRRRHGPIGVQLIPARQVPQMRRIKTRPILGLIASGIHAVKRPLAGPTGETKLAVRTGGLVRVEPGLVIERRGEPVPVLTTTDGAWFVGTPRRDRYADYEVVTARPGASPAMQARQVHGCADPLTAVNHELVLEEDRIYYVGSPTADPFYWTQAFAGTPAEMVFDAPDLLEGPAGVGIEVCGTAGRDGPDHRAEVSLNGQYLGAVEWEGRGIEELNFAVPEGLLQESGNLISIGTSDDADVIFADRINVTYTRDLRAGAAGLEFSASTGQCLQVSGADSPQTLLLDVTDPGRPVVLTGFEAAGDTLVFRDEASGRRDYLVAVPAAAPAPETLGLLRRFDFSFLQQSADYLIVTHPDFLGAAKRLNAYQWSRGLRACIAVTSHIYDTYSHGRPDPRAIRDLVRMAAPSYLLLLGGATVDSNDRLGAGNRDFVPAPFVVTVKQGWEAAADGWYAGENATAVGRLAVASPDEARAVVDKIIAQQSLPPLGRMVVVADRDADVPTRFEDMADALMRACLPGSLEADRLSVGDSQDPGAELKALADAGTDVIAFAGHAFLTGWSSPPLVTVDDAAGYANQHKFLLLSFSCFDGAFTGPWGEALAWSFVRNPDGGAAAALASSSLTDHWAVRMLSEQVLCQLTSGEAATVGQAVLHARKVLCGLNPALDDALATFNLLGDPATPNPWAD